MYAKKMLVLVLFVLGMLCMSLVGCSSTAQSSPSTSAESQTGASDSQASLPSPSETKVTSDNITLNMWCHIDPAGSSPRSIAFNQMLEEFKQAYPNIEVAVDLQVWQNLGPNIMAAHYAGNAPDVLWIEIADAVNFVNAGVYEPFENLFLDEWGPEDFSDIAGTTWDMATDNSGKHYFFYIARSLFGLVYRSDIFESFGVDPNFKSWEELISAAQKMTYVDPATGMQVWGLGLSYTEDTSDTSYLYFALEALNGKLFNDNGTAYWATQAGVDALQLQIDMIDRYKITPSSCISETYETTFTDFCAGKYAMIHGGSTRISTFQAQCVFDPEYIQMMPYPDIDGKPSKSVPGGWCIGVWSGSQHKYEAGKLVEAMASRSADQLWVEVGGQAPIRASTLETMSDYFNDPLHRYLEAAVEITNNHSLFPKCSITGMRPSLNRAMTNAYVGGMGLMESLENAEREFNELNGVG